MTTTTAATVTRAAQRLQSLSYKTKRNEKETQKAKPKQSVRWSKTAITNNSTHTHKVKHTLTHY